MKDKKVLLAMVAIAVAAVVGFLVMNGDKDKSSNSSSSNTNSASSQTSQSSSFANQQPVKQIKACDTLTLTEVQAVYPGKTFAVKVNRNDEPNIFEALSACQYQQSGVAEIDAYYIDLEIRAKESASEAKRIFDGDKELLTDRKPIDKSGIGDGAYIDNRTMINGGPHLIFYKDNVNYKLRINTLAEGAAATAHAELEKMAAVILTQ